MGTVNKTKSTPPAAPVRKAGMACIASGAAATCAAGRPPRLLRLMMAPMRPDATAVRAPGLGRLPQRPALGRVVIPRTARPIFKLPTFGANLARAQAFRVPGARRDNTAVRPMPPRPARRGPVDHHADKLLHAQHAVHQATAYFEIGEQLGLRGLGAAARGTDRLTRVLARMKNVSRVVRVGRVADRLVHTRELVHHALKGPAKVVNVAAKVQGAMGIAKAFEMACDPRTSHAAAAKQLFSSGLSMLGPGGAAASFLIDAIGPSAEEEMQARRAVLRKSGINFEGRSMRAEDPETARRTRDASIEVWAKELVAVGATREDARALVDEWAATNYRLNGGEVRGGSPIQPARVAVPDEAERRAIVKRFEREIAPR